MDNELKRSSKNTFRMLVYLAIVIVIVGLFAILPKIFSAQDMLFQTVAVVLSVVFTAVVTNQLLTGQSNNEESRERNIKVYENKISVYAEFISRMWDIMNDNKVEPEEIISLRSEIFNKLIFYLDDSQIKAISMELGNLKSDSTDQDYITAFEKITKVLRSSIIGAEQEEGKTEIKTLWNRFNNLLPAEVGKDNASEVPVPAANVGKKLDRTINRNCIHFNTYWQEWQYQIFANGLNALGLCEYGEEWRTNLVKRVNKDDIVFLYRTGGPGYVGVFLVKGWIVFEADGSGNIEKEIKTEFERSDEHRVVDSEAEKARDAELLCAKEIIDDGSTRVSYLLVEPLIYCEEGVGAISVYRRTISSYYSQYAWNTLGRFKALLDYWPNGLNKYHINGQEKSFIANETALRQIFTDNNVQDADWDENTKEWIDK